MDLDLLSVNTIRYLAVDAEQRASSGHPGLPKGGRVRRTAPGCHPGAHSGTAITVLAGTAGGGSVAQSTYVARLLEKVPRAEDIVSFRFERPGGYEYQAGQWLVITLPDSAARGSPPPGSASDPDRLHTHHFSHSSSPLDPWLEFTTRLRGTEFKDALAALLPGSEVELEGPYGSFVLPPGAGKVAFIAGGIGVTCVRSILRWLGHTWPASAGSVGVGGRGGTSTPSGRPGPEPARPDRIVLFLANSTERGIAFREELDDLEERLPPLRVVHVLSGADEQWHGRRGHIDERVVAEELQDPEGWDFYLSGPPSMVRSMGELLMAWGVDPAAMRMERFEGYE